jgi:hypothetical protein
MAGYTRQSSANIINAAVIQAAHFNNEYNALETAFSAASGHAHGGSAGEGARVVVLGPAGELIATATDIKPNANNTIDVGLTGTRFKAAYFSGNVNTSAQLVSTVATGTAPLAVSSTTVVTNLNADKLDGNDASAFLTAEADTLDTVLGRGFTTTTVPAFNGGIAVGDSATFESNNSTVVTITNTGSADTLVINDASGDTTPFVIDASGNVVVGHTAQPTMSSSVTPGISNLGAANKSSVAFIGHIAGASGPRLILAHNRHATPGSHTALQDLDNVARLQWEGSDGTNYQAAAAIIASVNGSVSSGIVPGKITFYTADSSAGTLSARMNIECEGGVAIGKGTTSAEGYALLELSSTTRGFVPPRMNSTQRDAMSPGAGTMIYNTTTNKFQGYNGAWVDLH